MLKLSIEQEKIVRDILNDQFFGQPGYVDEILESPYIQLTIRISGYTIAVISDEFNPLTEEQSIGYRILDQDNSSLKEFVETLFP